MVQSAGDLFPFDTDRMCSDAVQVVYLTERHPISADRILKNAPPIKKCNILIRKNYKCDIRWQFLVKDLWQPP